MAMDEINGQSEHDAKAQKFGSKLICMQSSESQKQLSTGSLFS